VIDKDALVDGYQLIADNANNPLALAAKNVKAFMPQVKQ
jgi:hypothetical protein